MKEKAMTFLSLIQKVEERKVQQQQQKQQQHQQQTAADRSSSSSIVAPARHEPMQRYIARGARRRRPVGMPMFSSKPFLFLVFHMLLISISSPLLSLILPSSPSREGSASWFPSVLLYANAAESSSTTSTTTDSSTSTTDSELSGRLKLIRRCDTNIIYVNSIYMTCDSPGSYYYGSGGYRKSSRCKYGDKADTYIFFSISEDYGAYGIDVSIDVGVLNSFANVQAQTSLCDMGYITYLGNSNNINGNNDDDTYSDDASINSNVYCPTPGNYLLHWSFTMPSGGADQQLQFLPDMRIKFYSQDESNTTLGCAGTGTVATVHNATMHSKEGEIALGIALSAFFLVFGCCLAMAYRRKKQIEEDMDGRQMHRRYYFARNSATGEIVPISGNPPQESSYPPMTSHDPYAAPQHQQHHHQQYAADQYSYQQQQPSTTGDQYSYESYENTTLEESSETTSQWQRRQHQPPEHYQHQQHPLPIDEPQQQQEAVSIDQQPVVPMDERRRPTPVPIDETFID